MAVSAFPYIIFAKHGIIESIQNGEQKRNLIKI